MVFHKDETYIKYVVDDQQLDAEVFLELVQKVWPGRYHLEKTGQALKHTLNVTAWDGSRLVGCVRILSDGYFFGTIPEILVDPAYKASVKS